MRYLRIALITLSLSLGASVPVASAYVTHTPNGHRISFMLRHTAKKKPGSGGSSSGAVLLNHGGPVLSAESPYLIYWTPPGYPIANSSESLLNQYMTDVAADSGRSTTNVYSVVAQYGAPYSQTFSSRSQAVIDTNAYPTPGAGCKLATGMTACVTDSALQSEISHLIDTGVLPAPGAPGSGVTPDFLMITPVDVNVCTSGGSCVSNSFCAYHDYFSHNGRNVLYASVPFSVFASNPKGCQTDQYSIYETPVGSSGDQAYNVADDLSHELSETITDPLINAWYSKNGYEIGDLCEAYGQTANTQKGLSPLAYAPAYGDASTGTLYDQVINAHQYYNQTEYSNTAGKCLTGTTSLPAP